jgi:hypothetical protein
MEWDEGLRQTDGWTSLRAFRLSARIGEMNLGNGGQSVSAEARAENPDPAIQDCLPRHCGLGFE